MKIAKPAVLVMFGILAALLAVGCSNPSFPSGGVGDAGPETYSGPGIDPDSSFTVTFTLGQSDTARSVAGPDADRIYLTGATGIRNFVQLVVVDKDKKEIKGLAENRKESDGDSEFTLTLDHLVRGKEYAFLLLMGHWERGPNDGNNNYTYTEDEAPTLLSAGLAEKKVNVTGDTVVTITMYPVTVDTKFTSTENGNLTIEPKVTGGKPDAAYLPPRSDWDVLWTVQRAAAGTDGFEKALIPAQNIVGSPAVVNALKIQKNRFIPSYTTPSETGSGTTANSFSYDIPADKTKQDGNGGGAVNFNLEYVPFNLAAVTDWSGVTSTYFKPANFADGVPVWIIRNGLNDTAQNGDTNFSPNATAINRNGAVRFVIGLPAPPPEPPPGPHQDDELWVDNGEFQNMDVPAEPQIGFTTGGYDDNAEVWYAVVGAGETPPTQGDYIWIDSVIPGDHTEEIIVPDDLVNSDYDVYVVISKDGEVSPPEIIRSTGKVIVTPIWGTD
ncbi:hypothetical protein LQZ21_11120 [Treponema sp. TIM-1]|uniref:hypothetical protein n=1 Tax=Treponema sp. TIM-1 TaxID=2898417 RepID=UPI0039813677